jgi:hypothetical protein
MHATKSYAGVEALESRQLMSGPTATFQQYVTGTADSRTFAIVYQGPASIDRASLGGDDVLVFGPTATPAPVTFLGSAPYKPGTGIVARYRVDGITRGEYKIIYGEGAVADTVGNRVTGGTAGGFFVGTRGRTVPRLFNYVPPMPMPPSVMVVGTTYGPSFSAPPIDTSFGPVVRAIIFGGPPADVVGSTGVNVHFESVLAANAGAAGAGPITVQLSSAGAPNDLFDAAVGTNRIYETEIYTASRSDEKMTISGLDPSRRYRFQFLHGDSRGGAYVYFSTPQMFDLPTGQATNAPLSFSTSTADADANMMVEVGGTTGLIYRMPQCPTRGPSFSSVVIEQGPSIAPPPLPAVLPTARFVRSSVRLSGSSQTFDIAYHDAAGIDVATLDGTNVLVSGPDGFSALASLVKVTGVGRATDRVATYRIDGMRVTAGYTIYFAQQPVATVTLFYLRPENWTVAAPVTVTARKRHFSF